MSIYDERLSLIMHRCNDQDSIDQAVAYHHNHQEIMMECDVRLTKDGVHIAYHNHHYHQHRINNLYGSDLGDHILSIENILQQLTIQNMKLHLDVKIMKKNSQWQAAANAHDLVTLIEKYNMLDKVVVSNVEGQFLEECRELSSKIALGILYDEDYGYLRPTNKNQVHHFIGQILETHQLLNIHAVFFNQQWLKLFEKKFNMLDKVFYTLVKAGIKIAVWTVNQPQTANLFAQRGANWITTDQPESIRGLLINPSVQDIKPMLK